MQPLNARKLEDVSFRGATAPENGAMVLHESQRAEPAAPAFEPIDFCEQEPEPVSKGLAGVEQLIDRWLGDHVTRVPTSVCEVVGPHLVRGALPEGFAFYICSPTHRCQPQLVTRGEIRLWVTEDKRINVHINSDLKLEFRGYGGSPLGLGTSFWRDRNRESPGVDIELGAQRWLPAPGSVEVYRVTWDEAGELAHLALGFESQHLRGFFIYTSLPLSEL